MKKHLIIIILIISIYTIFENNYSYELNKKDFMPNTISIFEENIQVKTNDFNWKALFESMVELLKTVANLLSGTRVVSDGKLTNEVKRILSDNNLRWTNLSGLSCAAAGINENDTSNGAKIACLAYARVGSTTGKGECCDFVKKIYSLAGKSVTCFNNSTNKTKKMGDVVQWGNSGGHVAIYISDSHVISGGYSSGKIVDLTLNKTSSTCYSGSDLRNFHN